MDEALVGQVGSVLESPGLSATLFNEFTDGGNATALRTAVSNEFFWHAGDYELVFEIETDRTAETIRKMWTFSISPEEEQDLRLNIIRLVRELCYLPRHLLLRVQGVHCLVNRRLRACTRRRAMRALSTPLVMRSRATVVVPPARTANVSGHGPWSPARNRTITLVKTLGRRRWNRASGCHRQGRLENTFFRCKSIIGDGLRARSPGGQGSEVVLGCEIFNRITGLGRPVSYRIGR